METALSLLATFLSLGLACWVGRQFMHRRRPYQCVWAAALGLFAVATACQFLSEIFGWSAARYRLWYLSGALLAAAYLGQGTVYLLARRRIAHTVMAVLLTASVVVVIAVARAPVDLTAAMAGDGVSGQGMPRAIRALTPFFNIFGTVALVGGAILSVARFLWDGGSGRRAGGTAMIGVGAVVLAGGGTVTRLGIPGALYLSELVGMVVIFSGFSLTASAGARSGVLGPSVLYQRRRRVTRPAVGLSVAGLFAAVAILPVLPWTMGIVADAKHVYVPEVPTENRGTYLVTDQGAMQLFSWYVEPPSFPTDAPALDAGSIQTITVVQKQFEEPNRYQLYDVSSNQRITWQDVETKPMRLDLRPDQLSAAGDYMLVVPTGGMFGGQTWHYFRLR